MQSYIIRLFSITSCALKGNTDVMSTTLSVKVAGKLWGLIVF